MYSDEELEQTNKFSREHGDGTQYIDISSIDNLEYQNSKESIRRFVKILGIPQFPYNKNS